NIVKGCAAVGDAQSKLHNMYQVIGADTLQTLLPDPVGLLKQATEGPKLEIALVATALVLIAKAQPVAYFELLKALDAQRKITKGTLLRQNYNAILSLGNATRFLSNKAAITPMT
ncbi:hypothetical protein TI03_06615, partial [Achromatium sp. WMS1]